MIHFHRIDFLKASAFRDFFWMVKLLKLAILNGVCQAHTSTNPLSIIVYLCIQENVSMSKLTLERSSFPP